MSKACPYNDLGQDVSPYIYSLSLYNNKSFRFRSVCKYATYVNDFFVRNTYIEPALRGFNHNIYHTHL